MTAPAAPDLRALDRGLAVLAIAMLIPSLALGVFNPVYTDEIGWKIRFARWLSDGVVVTNFPSCGPGFAAPVPATMAPFRFIDSILFGDLRDPVWLRWTGLGFAAIYLTILLGLLPGAAPALPPAAIRAGAAGLLGLGVMPFLLSMNRPELFLNLGSASLALVPFCHRIRDRAATLRLAVVIALGLFVFATHPKGVLLAPMAAGAAWLLCRETWARTLAGAALGFGLASALVYWYAVYERCDDPHIARLLRSNMIGPGQLLADPLGSLHTLVVGLVPSSVINRLGRTILFTPSFSEGWLVLPMPLALARLLNRVITAAWLLPGLLVVAGGLIAVTTRRVRDGRLAMFLASGLALALSVSLQTQRNFYETAFVFPLLLITAAFATGVAGVTAPWLRRVAVAIVVVATASQALLWVHFAPRIPELGGAAGPVKDQLFSVGVIRYRDVVGEIEAAAAGCAIDLDRANRHLIIDDVTYPRLSRSVDRPLHALFLGPTFFPDGTRLLEVLAELRPSGLIAECRRVPAPLASRVIRVGRFCCLGAFDESVAPGRGKAP